MQGYLAFSDLFLEGILDFYLHELSKYALYQMFLGRWEKSARYQNLQLKMQDVETTLDAPESKTWFFRFLNERFSRDVFLAAEIMKDQLNLIGVSFSDAMSSAFPERNAEQSIKSGKAFVSQLFDRRNAIAHQVDRSHTSAEKNDITREYVEECIDGVCRIVDAVHSLAEKNG